MIGAGANAALPPVQDRAQCGVGGVSIQGSQEMAVGVPPVVRPVNANLGVASGCSAQDMEQYDDVVLHEVLDRAVPCNAKLGNIVGFNAIVNEEVRPPLRRDCVCKPHMQTIVYADYAIQAVLGSDLMLVTSPQRRSLETTIFHIKSCAIPHKHGTS